MDGTQKGGGSARQVTRFLDAPGNALRITSIRIVVQAVTFALFLSFVLLTTFANLAAQPRLSVWVGKLLEIDPLIAMATAMATHTVYKGLLWSLVILIPTLFLGRFFCSWICPFGTLHHFVAWVCRSSDVKDSIEANRYRASAHVKYGVLIAMLVLAFLGSLQIGLLDPICLFYRSCTVALIPAINMPTQSFFGDYRLHQGGWVVGAIVFGLVAMNLALPRFFCRVLCPLGALLGLVSRFAWWRIERDPVKCTRCDECLRGCEGACDPHETLRLTECLLCFNCIEDCPEGALRFAYLPQQAPVRAGPDLPRRQAVFAAVTGLLFFPFARTSGRTTRDFSAKVIRPPGTVEELELIERCIKCAQCIRVCPTGTLQPAGFEAGLEGIWTPILNFRMGHCQLSCTACSQVCPTGAIQRLSVDEKLGRGRYTEQGPVKLGTAHVDLGRCLPSSKNIPCVVCEEFCPTSPKAIHSERELRIVRDGRKMAVAATDDTVTVCEWPEPGKALGRPARFGLDCWRGDEDAPVYAVVCHVDGAMETHRVVENDVDTLRMAGRFSQPPDPGSSVTLHRQLQVPYINPAKCVGCGICERTCPVVGDRRAVYVTAEGETRSQHHPDPDRNRSLRLHK